MQLIHTTLTWDGPVPTAISRNELAIATWAKHSRSNEYVAAHFHPDTFKINATMIGDPEPHVLLKDLINTGFGRGTDQDDVLLLANSDVRLIPGMWGVAWARALAQIPSYEGAIDHKPKQLADHLWQPQSFWLPRHWWEENEYRCPPIWWPAPWWEPVMYNLIGNANATGFGFDNCTSHIPHPRAKCIDDMNNATVQWNYSVQFGWYKCGFAKPKNLGRLKIKMPHMPENFLCPTSISYLRQHQAKRATWWPQETEAVSTSDPSQPPTTPAHQPDSEQETR